jgi:hypothetical protein
MIYIIIPVLLAILFLGALYLDSTSNVSSLTVKAVKGAKKINIKQYDSKDNILKDDTYYRCAPKFRQTGGNIYSPTREYWVLAAS